MSSKLTHLEKVAQNYLAIIEFSNLLSNLNL